MDFELYSCVSSLPSPSSSASASPCQDYPAILLTDSLPLLHTILSTKVIKLFQLNILSIAVDMKCLHHKIVYEPCVPGLLLNFPALVLLPSRTRLEDEAMVNFLRFCNMPSTSFTCSLLFLKMLNGQIWPNFAGLHCDVYANAFSFLQPYVSLEAVNVYYLLMNLILNLLQHDVSYFNHL